MGRALHARAGRLLCALLVGLAAAACAAGPDSGLSVAVELSPSPPRVGGASVSVRVTDATGKALPGAAVRVEGNMNHAGMVPELAEARETGDGRYVADLELTMDGD